MRAKLYKPKLPKDTEVFCGPTAIMAVTNCSYKQVLKHAGKKKIRGMYCNELTSVIHELGYKVKQCHRWDYEWGDCSFNQWLQAPERDLKSTYIVVVTNHYVAVAGYRFVDSWTKAIVDVTENPHKRKRVKRVFKIVK